MTAPHSQNLTSAPSTPPAKSAPKRKGWAGIGLFVGITLLGFLVGLGLGAFGFVDWVGGWTWSDLDMSVAAQPLATILSASGVILAARIALHNGKATRINEREMQKEAAKRDTERSLRDRFFKITETLSESGNYVRREAGVYALVALADDWADFHRDNPDAAKREQQTCLNVIVGQLREQLSITSSSLDHKPSPVKGAQHNGEQSQHDLALLTFKHRVQDIILERFRSSDGGEAGKWSHLNLDLSNCHFHDASVNRAFFHGDAVFDGAHFHGGARFDGAHFDGLAQFEKAHFDGLAHFDGTHFGSLARFENAHFDSFAVFEGAHFHSYARFDGAHFDSPAVFDGAHFHSYARFDGAHFDSLARFNSAHFHSDAMFWGSQFCDDLVFANFHGEKLNGMFMQARFKAEKATVVEWCAGQISKERFEEVFENSVFSASCPFDSPVGFFDAPE